MPEFIIAIRVRTEREPRDDLKWEVVSDTLKSLFKARPTGPLDVLGLTIRQVERGQS